MDKNEYEKIDWRTPSKAELEKLRDVSVQNRNSSVALIGAIVFIAVCVTALITVQLKISINNWPMSVMSFVIALAVVIFIIRRIHFRPEIKVSDAVLKEIHMTDNPEIGIAYLATVTQGETTLTSIRFYGEKTPEINTKMLLFKLGNDSWNVGIV
jgi:hypothetical protein